MRPPQEVKVHGVEEDEVWIPTRRDCGSSTTTSTSSNGGMTNPYPPRRKRRSSSLSGADGVTLYEEPPIFRDEQPTKEELQQFRIRRFFCAFGFFSVVAILLSVFLIPEFKETMTTPLRGLQRNHHNRTNTTTTTNNATNTTKVGVIRQNSTLGMRDP